jgi:ribosomal protein S1
VVPPSTIRERHRPALVDVTVADVGEDEVEVRLADGRAGVVPRRELLTPPEVGEQARAAVLAREDPRGRVCLSVAWARTVEAWDRAEAAHREGSTLNGTVTKEVKGGFVVDLGVRAFLPRSLAGVLEADSPTLVGSRIEVSVHEVVPEDDRLVVSRRDVQRREQRRLEKAAWSDIAVGQRRSGVVVAVEDYGAKVDLAPLRGLIHRSELTWGRMGHPSDVVTVGEPVEVLVLEVSRSKRRIALSLRQTRPHPFEGLEPGGVHDAVVVKVLDYGVFARLEGTGAEGLVHVSELSTIPGARADQLVVPGEQLRVKVLSVDRERNRLALSVLQAVGG